jgi:nucleoside-triphosphatase
VRRPAACPAPVRGAGCGEAEQGRAVRNRNATHILIVGCNGAGKSALIRRLLHDVPVPVYGFRTRMEAPACVGGAAPVYIHGAAGESACTRDYLVGTCCDGRPTCFPAAFERAVPLLRGIPSGSIVLMDELGVMESDATGFCAAVLDCLDGEELVIAAVRDKQTAFLEAVRAHPRAKCLLLTPENGDALFLEAKALLVEQLGSPRKR